MNIEFWKNLKQVKDDNNPFCPLFIYDNGDSFYVEPIFYTKLVNLFEHHPLKKQVVLDEMEKRVIKNHHVVFVGTFEYPQTEVGDEFIFLELEDITNPLQIYVEDKSRGSDYGD